MTARVQIAALLTPEEAAALLQVSTKTLTRLRKAGLRFVTIGRQV